MPAAISEHQDAIALRTSRPQSLIFTIYGAYSRSLGGWIAVSSLLALLREMNIEDNAVRSALSRLKRRGVLLSEAHNGFAGYALVIVLAKHLIPAMLGFSNDATLKKRRVGFS